METKELQEALETILDKSSLSEMLDALAVVCYEKAEHLRSNWQDDASAVVWDGAGDRLDRIAASPSFHLLP